jgi:hypothetical protein
VSFLPDHRLLRRSRHDVWRHDPGLVEVDIDTPVTGTVGGPRSEDWHDARMRLHIAQARYRSLDGARVDPRLVADATAALLAARARIEDLHRAQRSDASGALAPD